MTPYEHQQFKRHIDANKEAAERALRESVRLLRLWEEVAPVVYSGPEWIPSPVARRRWNAKHTSLCRWADRFNFGERLEAGWRFHVARGDKFFAERGKN